MSKDRDDRLQKCRKRYSQTTAELQSLGFVCVGSLQTRRLECGKPACHCHADPDHRHGPYHYWTRKLQQKTVAVLITEDELGLYREWIDNNRALERAVREMRKISARALALHAPKKKSR